MSVCVVGFGTALLPTVHTSQDYMNRLHSVFESDFDKIDENKQIERKQLLKFFQRLTKAADIDTRYTCDEILDLEQKFNYQIPYYYRMKLWYKYACDLATTACDDAINQYINNCHGQKEDITHILCHSVTGWRVPGISHFILQHFGLSKHCRTIELNFNGCHGGTQLIYNASCIVRNQANACVLICDTEIMEAACSYSSGINYEQLVTSNRSEFVALSLFASGAGCMIMKNIKPLSLEYFQISNNSGLWCLDCINQESIVIPDSNDDIVFDWQINKKSDQTCVGLRLAPESWMKIENVLNNEFNKWFNQYFGCNTDDKDVNLDDVELAIHCGGKKYMKIVEKYFLKKSQKNNNNSDDTESKLNDRINTDIENQKNEKSETKSLLKYSFDIYKKCGNQSGASIFFVLENVFKNTKKNNILFMTFGIGITIHYGTMEKLTVFNAIKQAFSLYWRYLVVFVLVVLLVSALLMIFVEW